MSAEPNHTRRLTALQTACAVVVAVVSLGFALIVSGIVLLWGLAWALIAAGSLLAAGAVAGGIALLREPGRAQP